MCMLVNGAGGRMGKAIIAAAAAADGVAVTAALERKGSPCLGADAGLLAGLGANGVTVSDKLPSDLPPDVAIDFSQPAGTMSCLKQCVSASVPMVIGTTGFDHSQHQRIIRAGRHIPIVLAPNMSIGVNICLAVLEQVAVVLGDRADIEIVEAHHAGKRDAPSGTALAMGEVLAGALGRKHSKSAEFKRFDSSAPRRPGSIGYSSIRLADVVGEHTVLFGLPGESVEISHKARHRDVFAYGALRAARWLATGRKPAGLYDMRAVLGLS